MATLATSDACVTVQMTMGRSHGRSAAAGLAMLVAALDLVRLAAAIFSSGDLLYVRETVVNTTYCVPLANEAGPLSLVVSAHRTPRWSRQTSACAAYTWAYYAVTVLMLTQMESIFTAVNKA